MRPLLAAALAVGTLGLLGQASVGGDVLRQGAYLALGTVLMVGLSSVHYGRLKRLSIPLYFASLGCLGLVMVLGQAARGARRWLSLGPAGAFQPSELAKIALIVALADLLSRSPQTGWRQLCRGLALLVPPFLLTLLQPDLGTACVLLAITFCMLFLAGGSALVLGGLLAGGAALLPFVLHGYQRDRLAIFMNPDLDPSGIGYNLAQSKTAIGSGGFWGQGWGLGAMSQHGFVPENHTDFIITVLGEELGLLGCLGLLLLYAVLMALLVRLCWRAPSRFGALLLGGITTMLGFQILVNLGMTTGLAPAVGIPLPLVSYGGSSVLVTFMGLGMAGGVARVLRQEAPARDWAGPYDPFAQPL